ncbi:glycosyltransferase [Carboxylicivirga sp. N1Y90]|uniref:glycosyltransferase n=1 Tax=Carboxylicivirga fragile TaxID=3417571 RepID=UPI003D3597E4|nr:hypothetical protein [Marinilabiliaceae bacterium N1Y90]
MFKHFLITRFNLRNFPLGEKKQDEWVQWTRDRISLFDKYCLPSLSNQSNKDFKWFIYFDTQTPDEFTDYINKLNGFEFIKVCYSDGMDSFDKVYIEDIKNNIGDSSWAMISRIDNDDCFDSAAIERIQESFVKKDGHLISLASGYTLDLKKNILSHYFYPMSPFLTIIESTTKKNIKGVFCKPHSSWNELRLFMYKEVFGLNKQSTFILDKPYWLQIVHDDNVSNSFKRGFPVLKSINLASFGINAITKKQSVLNISGYFNYVFWKRYFKASVVKCFKK